MRVMELAGSVLAEPTQKIDGKSDRETARQTGGANPTLFLRLEGANSVPNRELSQSNTYVGP